MRLRRVIAFLATASLWAATAIPAVAADSGTVDASVTVATPCLTVGPSIDYGSLKFGVPSGGSSSFTNCSTYPESIYMRGTDAVSASSAATWQLTSSPSPCTAGPNLYMHQAGVIGNAVTLTNSDQLVWNTAAGVTEQLLTALEMPCAGSDGAGETMTFSIIVTASF